MARALLSAGLEEGCLAAGLFAWLTDDCLAAGSARLTGLSRCDPGGGAGSDGGGGGGGGGDDGGGGGGGIGWPIRPRGGDDPGLFGNG